MNRIHYTVTAIENKQPCEIGDISRSCKFLLAEKYIFHLYSPSSKELKPFAAESTQLSHGQRYLEATNFKYALSGQNGAMATVKEH